jgi:hypothetical protein
MDRWPVVGILISLVFISLIIYSDFTKNVKLIPVLIIIQLVLLFLILYLQKYTYNKQHRPCRICSWPKFLHVPEYQKFGDQLVCNNYEADKKAKNTF